MANAEWRVVDTLTHVRTLRNFRSADTRVRTGTARNLDDARASRQQRSPLTGRRTDARRSRSRPRAPGAACRVSRLSRLASRVSVGPAVVRHRQTRGRARDRTVSSPPRAPRLGSCPEPLSLSPVRSPLLLLRCAEARDPVSAVVSRAHRLAPGGARRVAPVSLSACRVPGRRWTWTKKRYGILSVSPGST